MENPCNEWKTRYNDLELDLPERLLIKSSESLILRWWLFFDDEVRAAAQSNLPAASF